MYSVQQLLFDSMRYLKEFGCGGEAWHVAVMGPELDGIETGYAVWLHRPALSSRAAETAAARLRNRFGVRPLPQPYRSGRYLFLGKAFSEGLT
ncbi:MAG TPA: hypothetical protein VFG62_22640 [Rhodopila sp.]|jgi:hypothetical protein|nr:hypothetical protein [Rhodopila sp.]